MRYYEYSPSRSHQVALRLLGERFRGMLVSDFYAAYNLIPGRHQRCWTHLLRDLHELEGSTRRPRGGAPVGAGGPPTL